MKTKGGSIYYKGKKVAVMQSIEYTLTTNDGQEITDGGVHNTDGVLVTRVTANVLVPVKGVGVSVVDDLVNHRDVTLTLAIIDGSMHELQEARAEEGQFSGEVQNGRLTGRFTWHAGAPKISRAPGL